jgi:hypothetical protein
MIADVSSAPVLGMTPGQALEILHRDLSLTPKDLQVVLSTTPKNIERWIQEQTYPQTKARQQLVQLMELHRHLGDMFTEWEGARAWINAPSRYLGGITPLEAMHAGRLDRAHAALMALDSGVYV